MQAKRPGDQSMTEHCGYFPNSADRLFGSCDQDQTSSQTQAGLLRYWSEVQSFLFFSSSHYLRFERLLLADSVEKVVLA
jgi:hypothetical protein